MRQIRLTVRCQKEEAHAKILRFSGPRKPIEALAALLDGSSPAYIHPPGDGSPIGRCVICGGRLKCTLEEVETNKGPSN